MNPSTSPSAATAAKPSPAVPIPQSLHLGTWKLNEAKSNIPADVQKYTTVVYEPQGDMIKCITLGTTPDGQPIHLEWLGKFDGKEYPTRGDRNSDQRSYTLQNDGSLAIANRKNGKPTTTGRVLISPDGKTRTIQATGVDPDGKPAAYTGVYDRL